jgi:TnpA family transposase
MEGALRALRDREGRRLSRRRYSCAGEAFAEVGKAEKTIFLCDYLVSREVQREVHEGRNVVEDWNATNDFIC